MRDFQRPNRSAAYAEKGMIATSHPEAAMAGLDVLRDGGSAADAAIAAAAVMAVAEPQNAGLGGDTFYIHAGASGALSAYNGSGRLPAAFDPDAAGPIGLDSVHSVTVPGAVDAMMRLHADHGRLPIDRLLRPAIRLAHEGCLTQPRVAWDWQFSAGRLSASPTTCAQWGRPCAAGQRFVQPALARTLRDIAHGGSEAFYKGETAETIVRTLRAMGGTHTLDDFAGHKGEAVVPIRTTYRGLDIAECPPNGQGMTVLLMLNILSGLDMGQVWDSPERWAHVLAAVSQLAYRERDRWVCDPQFASAPLATVLSANFAARLRDQIDEKAPQLPPIQEPEHKDTVYLACVDRDGNAISFINSIFTDFGSAIFDDESGLLLHNRGASFSPIRNHPNAAAAAKRPMHTIIPGMAMKDNRPVMPFGVMGGHYQAAGQVQLLSAMLDAGLDPQQAVELPRHFNYNGVVELEQTVPESVAAGLSGRGYPLIRAARPIGGGQAVFIDHQRSLLIGGSDPRKDGYAIGY